MTKIEASWAFHSSAGKLNKGKGGIVATILMSGVQLLPMSVKFRSSCRSLRAQHAIEFFT